MRKIIQIAFDTEGDIETGEYSGRTSGSISSTIWALCDDHTVWFYKATRNGYEWELWDHPIPQGDLSSLRKSSAATVPE